MEVGGALVEVFEFCDIVLEVIHLLLQVAVAGLELLLLSLQGEHLRPQLLHFSGRRRAVLPDLRHDFQFFPEAALPELEFLEF